MVGTNKFFPNSTAAGAKVMSDADYLASDALSLGAQVGELPPEYYNKVNRQATLIASMIGQFIVDNANVDANDSQSVSLLKTNFLAALGSVISGVSTGIINNYFLTRPAMQQIFVDPASGSDSADGSTPAKARLNIDNVLDQQANVGTAVICLGDVTIRRRRNIYAPLAMYGGQANSDKTSWVYADRKCTFIATADNSPLGDGTTFCSGFWLQSSTFFTNRIYWSLPIQPTPQTFGDHIRSDYGTGILIRGSSLLVDGPGAGSLIANIGGLPVDAILTIGFAAGAAGHLFAGISAGGNPNTNPLQYRTNVLSG